MSTVGQVADRVFANWLYPADDQPLVVTLSEAVTAADTTIPYDDSTVAPDEEDALAPGVLVELVGDGNTELCRVSDVDPNGNTITVVRGVAGTVATDFDAGAEVTVSPLFTRSAVVEAVKDNVAALYPSLWHVATDELTSGPSFVEVPATVITPKKLVWQNGTRFATAAPPQLLTNFPPSSTGVAIQTYGVPVGYSMWFTYESEFARPETEAEELADLGVERRWERIVEVGAAAQVVGARPVDSLSAEYLTEQLEREALPPGASTDVRNGLLTLRSIFIDEAHRQLTANQEVPVVYNTLAGSA